MRVSCANEDGHHDHLLCEDAARSLIKKVCCSEHDQDRAWLDDRCGCHRSISLIRRESIHLFSTALNENDQSFECLMMIDMYIATPHSPQIAHVRLYSGIFSKCLFIAMGISTTVSSIEASVLTCCSLTVFRGPFLYICPLSLILARKLSRHSVLPYSICTLNSHPDQQRVESTRQPLQPSLQTPH